MTARVGRPQYGGAFETQSGGAFESEAGPPLRFVLAGELVERDGLHVLEASPQRVAPRCRHFGECGGCDYQHAAYAEQIRIKREVLEGILQAQELAFPEIEVHVAEPWEYRNRIRLRMEDETGAVRFGYNRRGGRDFLPIVECPISAPLLLRAAEALVSLQALPWVRSIAEVEFHASDAAVQMSVFTRDGRTEGFAAFCETLQALLPELSGAGVMALSAGIGAKERAAWGAGGLVQTVLGRRYWVTRGGFFQVNRFLVESLVDLVTRERAGALAWDLYAGVGLFSRVLAEHFERVTGVEAGVLAAADLARRSKGESNLDAVRMETVEFLQRALLQRERPGLIVMDPPRAGLGPEVCALLARIAAPELVYVSCDPTTLARDLRMLVDSGYQVSQTHLVDMFPQTFHLETVVFLTKEAAEKPGLA